MPYKGNIPWNKGKKTGSLSLIHRLNIGLGNKGKKRSDVSRIKYSLSKKGKSNHREGTHHSQSTIEKMKLSAKVRVMPKWSQGRRLRQAQRQRGSCSHFWKGGITEANKLVRSMFEYKLWREAVFARDNWTCQMCGKRGCYLHADHIKSFSSILEENNIRTVEDALSCALLWDISNGRVLCVPCHKTTETFVGRGLRR